MLFAHHYVIVILIAYNFSPLKQIQCSLFFFYNDYEIDVTLFIKVSESAIINVCAIQCTVFSVHAVMFGSYEPPCFSMTRNYSDYPRRSRAS